MGHHVLTPARRDALAAAGVSPDNIIDFGHRIDLPGEAEAREAADAERDKRRAAATYAERKPRSRLAEREAEHAASPIPTQTLTWQEAEADVLRRLALLRQDAARPDRANSLERARELGAERAKHVIRAQVAAADRRWAECAYSVRELAQALDNTATNGPATARKAAAKLQDACLRFLNCQAFDYIQGVARGS